MKYEEEKIINWGVEKMREIVEKFKMKVENVKIFRSGHKTRE
jgi:hypothetical protein